MGKKKKPLTTIRQQELTRAAITTRLPPLYRMIDQHCLDPDHKNYRELKGVDVKLMSVLFPYALPTQKHVEVKVEDVTKKPHEVLAALRESLGGQAVDLIQSVLSGKNVLTQEPEALEILEVVEDES